MQKPARRGAGGRSYTLTISPSYTLCVSESKSRPKKNAERRRGRENLAWRNDLNFSKLPSRSSAADHEDTLAYRAARLVTAFGVSRNFNPGDTPG